MQYYKDSHTCVPGRYTSHGFVATPVKYVPIKASTSLVDKVWPWLFAIALFIATAVLPAL